MFTTTILLPTPGGLGVGLVETQISIVESKIPDDKISITQLSNDLKVSTTTIEKHIEKLKELGWLKRDRTPRSGRWVIIEK